MELLKSSQKHLGWAIGQSEKKESDYTFILPAIRAHCSFTVGGAFPKEGA